MTRRLTGGSVIGRAVAVAAAAGLAFSLLPASGSARALANDGPGRPVTAAAAGQSSVVAPPPVIQTPAGMSSGTEPTLDWDSVSGASGYRVQIAAASDFTALVYDLATANTAATPAIDLAPGTHAWRVAAEMGGVTGTYASSTFVKLVTLAAPVQQEPSDGVTLQLPGEPPRLGWTAVPGAGSYELEFSSAPVMSDPFSGVTRTTSWVLEFLQPGQRLYWRVRAVSRGGTTSGPWSSIRSLAVDFQAIPGGLTPASGSAAPQMVVGWDPLPGAEGYDLAFTPGPALDWSDARTVSVVTAATRYAFDDPTATGPVTWGWRVRARDHHGNVGPWTTPRLITQSLVSGPVLTSPPNGTHIEEVAVLRWNPVHGASHYRVDVSPDPSFATKLDTHVTTETIFDLTTREEIDPFVLVKGTTYYWRVRGLDRGPSLSADARPASDWSSSGSFVYDPPVATLLSPADGSTITVPTLSWTAPGATFVKVTIRDRHGTFVDRALTYADSYTPPDRLDAKNGPFTWYVQRVALSADPDPTVAWTSAMWTFDLDPISATVSDPTPNVVPPSVVTPSISWTPVVGADHYDVFPGTVPPPPDAAYALNPRVLHYPAFTYAIGDLDVGAHDFHVRAYDAAGATIATGPLGSFTLTSLPAPVIEGPADCGDPGCPELAETPRFAWSLVPGATQYQATFAFPVPTRVDPPATTLGEVSPIGDAVDTFENPGQTWSVIACVERRCGPAAHASFRKHAPAADPIAPANGAQVVGPQVTFSWNDLLSSPAAPGTIGNPQTEDLYDQISVYGGDIGFWVDAEANEFSDILPPGTYTWGVTAYAGSGVMHGRIERSVTVSFPSPTPTQPPDGAVVPDTPNLAWDPRPFLTGYDVEIFRGSSVDAADQVATASIERSSYSPFDELAAGPYTWRVRSRSVSGSSAWSEPRTFVISTSASPTLTGPADDALVVGADVTFTWSSDPAATAYRFETSADPSFATTRESVVTGQAAWAPVAAYPSGTWQWRVSVLGPSGAILARSSTRTFRVDLTPPIGSLVIGDGSPVTASPIVSLATPASDPGSGLAQVAISNDGTTWDARAYAGVEPWVLAAGDGPKHVYARWQDAAGNWSAAVSATIVLDTLAPTATGPIWSLGSPGSALISGTVPIRLAWNGTDATSGIARFELDVSTDGSAWTSVSTTLTSAATTRSLAGGHRYRFRVRAVDRAGNVGAWAYGTTFKVIGVQQSSSAVHYGGTWATSTSTVWWGGTARSSTKAGSTVTYAFTGRSIAWVGLKGVGRGKANVYVNGVLKATVDLYSPTTLKQRIVWSANYSTSATRTITIKVLGTVGRPRVDVDGFVVAS